MANLLNKAHELVDRVRHAHLATAIVYRRPSTGQAVELIATPGQTAFRISDETGGTVLSRTRDYLIRAADLTLAGVAIEPEPFDRIEETVAGQTRTFEVLRPSRDEPAWRWSGSDRQTYRVHTKEVSG
jgi:hypothetical protein